MGVLRADMGTVTDRVVGSGSLQLTHRGQLVLAWVKGLSALSVLTVTLLVGAMLWGGRAVADSTPQPVSFSSRVVAPGETLWQIAAEVAPGSDPRDVVLKIIEVNHLSGANVAVGTRLYIPVF